MKNLEAVYDKEISPLMEQILIICKKYNMPMFAEFQYSNDGFCKSLLTKNGHPIITHLEALSQCIEDGGINIDKYMFWISKGAKKRGHSSIFLKAAGISEQPNN